MKESYSRKNIYPVPENEKERLEALYSYNILDSSADKDMDAITLLASRICQTPVAYVSLIDEKRQWFKAMIGFNRDETPREDSLCQYTIMQDKIYEIPDITKNELFSQNPLFNAKNGIQFYAGAPLIDPNGYRLGTLCVIDVKPRVLSIEQKEGLELLAREVVAHLIIRKDNLELAQSKAELQKFFDLSLDFMCIANVQGYFLKVSATFSSVLGYEEKELLGRPFLDFVHPEDIPNTLNEIDKLARGEDTIHFENRYRKVDGSYIWLSWNSKPEPNTGMLYASARDITEAKITEELNKKNIQLQKEKEVAERSSKLKEEFLANMSHEIRTPINAIIGITNLLLKKGTAVGKELEYIQTIHINSNNLFQLVNNILDFSQIESGKYNNNSTEFNLKQLIRETVRSIKLSATEKGLSLSTIIDPEIPMRLIGYPEKLSQTFLNLISNSIKFTSMGEIVVTAELVTLNPDSVIIKFIVADTGIGIPADKLDEIFLPFVQVNSSFTRVHGGTGLGLAITKKLVELQGGEIQVHSKVGVGSDFFFTLLFPIPEKEKTERNFVEEVEELLVPAGLRILIVEDNPFNQMVVTDTLQEWNDSIEIDVVENGKMAIEKLKINTYDLVLMDIQMPEMDGHTAARIIRSDFPEPVCNIPIIAMTAHASVKEIESCFKNGMNEYISKPFEASNLFKKIVKVLKK